MLSSIVDKYRRHRFAWLFASLLLSVAGHFVFQAVVPGITPLELLLALSLIAAIAGTARERSGRILIAVGLAFAATRVIAAGLGIDGLLPVSHLLWVIAGVLATVATVRHALRGSVIDTERIFAALDAYLLVGLMFGVCYSLLDRAYPGSFAGAALDGNLTLEKAIYFSFVTIATLGYGDIVPVSDAARGLANLEAISGQMYLAVLVAWLVSLFARSPHADA